MIDIERAFSASYAQARKAFLEAAAMAGASIQSHNHPLPGPQGEALAMDVARLGAPDAPKLLVLTSACHGVEGYCGSGIQVHALHDAELLAQARSGDVALLLVHALNPWGFAWTQRATQENVDLNRNGQDFAKPLPANPGYEQLAALLVPDVWPPTAANEAALGAVMAQMGEATFQAALSGGQYTQPDGLFYGGQSQTWSHATWCKVLSEHGRSVEHLGWIDFHTGLGPNGHGERIYAGPDAPEPLARAKRWWAGEGATPITSFYDGSSASARLTGLLWETAPVICPQAEITGMALEYGTVPLMEVAHALRGAHWLARARRRGQAVDAELARAIDARTLAAFYTDTPAWRAQVVAQARQANMQAIAALAAA